MVSSTGNKWLRPTEITKQFPSDKYAFSIHLLRPGDWVETNPLTQKEYYNIQDAAHFWAWKKGYSVKTESWPDGTGLKIVRITLTKLHRERDYD